MQLFLRHIYLFGLLFPFLSCSTTRICSDYISPSNEICHLEQDSTFTLQYHNIEYTGKWKQLDKHQLLFSIETPEPSPIFCLGQYALYGEKIALTALNRLNINSRCYHEYNPSKQPPYESFKLRPAYIDKIRRAYLYGYFCHPHFWHRIYKSASTSSKSTVHASDLPGALNECQAYPDSLSGLDVYFYVDTSPTYNNRPWIEELGKEFSRKFTYKYSEGEEFCFKVIVQFVINKEGKLVAPRIIECKNDSFGQAVLETLNSCQGSWTPGIVGEKNVNTMLYMPIVW